jgi:hypothetical protein
MPTASVGMAPGTRGGTGKKPIGTQNRDEIRERNAGMGDWAGMGRCVFQPLLLDSQAVGSNRTHFGNEFLRSEGLNHG